MPETTMTTLVDGLAAPESPRWHDGRLFFVDMNGDAVHSVTEDGELQTLAEVEGHAGGLGWLPDGQLLVASQYGRRILRIGPSGPQLHVDLSDRVDIALNDMYVAPDGTAYAGQMGVDIHEFGRLMAAGEDERAISMFRPTAVWAVAPDGTARPAADDIHFPNGIVAGPGEDRVLVAQSFAMELTLFDVGPDRTLGHRRKFASLAFAPDGIALDAEGCVWVADPAGRRVVRIAEGGEERQAIASDQICLSVELGGPDLRTLFVCTSDVTDPEESRRSRQGRVSTVRVDTPGVA